MGLKAMEPQQTTSTKKVLILGAGSAGLSASIEFNRIINKYPIEITVVDQKNYHFYRPLLYQVVTGSIPHTHATFPLHRLLMNKRSAKEIKFRQGWISSIDIESRKVTIDSEESEWDYLIVALGCTTNFFNMSVLEANAMPFRSLKDGIDLHNRIVDNFVAALIHDDEQRQRELLTFVVIGGGPTGVELAASIQEFIQRALKQEYPSLTAVARVILIEAQGAVLSAMKNEIGELAINKLRSRGVDVMLNTRVSKAWPTGLETFDGRVIPTCTIVWSAGVKPVPIVESLPFEKAGDGRIITNEYFEVPGFNGIYAIGDCAYVLRPDGSGPYPATHQVAVRQGPVCTRNIMNIIKGKSQRPFRYRFIGQVMYVDRNTSVAQVLGHVFDGCLAAIGRRLVFVWILITYPRLLNRLDRKLSTFLEWIFAYFYRRNTAHIE